MERAVEILGAAPLLRHVPAERLRSIVYEDRRLALGEMLAHAGDSATHVFLIVEGDIAALENDAAEQDEAASTAREVGKFGPGEWLGISALTWSAYLFSYQARSEVTLLALPKGDFFASFADSEAARREFLEMGKQRARVRVRLLGHSDPPATLRPRRSELPAGEDSPPPLASFIGSSEHARRIRSAALTAAGSDRPVLLLGETGTGKEVLARAIHGTSSRADRPFVALNCSALPEALLESELFGHVRGAFTGASRSKPGLVEVADGGTLFLDEVADMPLGVQAALLRFLELGEFRRLGDTAVRRADARVVAAANRSLEAAVAEGQFRPDLLFRLDVIAIQIPPLRERREDIDLLLEHILKGAAARLDREPLRLSPAARRRLQTHPFPGNVRELQNEIERLYVFAKQGVPIEEADLSPRFTPPTDDRSFPADTIASGSQPISASTTYADRLRDFKRALIHEALERASGNRTRAAELLGVHRSNLIRMIRDLDLAGPT